MIMYVLMQQKKDEDVKGLDFSISKLGDIFRTMKVNDAVFAVQPFMSYKHLINALSSDIDILKCIGETKNSIPIVSEFVGTTSPSEYYITKASKITGQKNIFIYKQHGNDVDSVENISLSLDENGQLKGFEIVDRGQLIQDVRKHVFSDYLCGEQCRYIKKLKWMSQVNAKKNDDTKSIYSDFFANRPYIKKHYRQYHVHRALVEDVRMHDVADVFEDLEPHIDIPSSLINELLNKKEFGIEDPWQEEKQIQAYRGWKHCGKVKKQCFKKQKSKGVYIEKKSTKDPFADFQFDEVA